MKPKAVIALRRAVADEKRAASRRYGRQHGGRRRRVSYAHFTEGQDVASPGFRRFDPFPADGGGAGKLFRCHRRLYRKIGRPSGDFPVDADGVFTVDADVYDFVGNAVTTAETGHSRRSFRHMHALHVRNIRQLSYDAGADDAVVRGKDNMAGTKFLLKGAPGQENLTHLLLQQAQASRRLG